MRLFRERMTRRSRRKVVHPPGMQLFEARLTLNTAYAEFIDPNPNPGNQFGHSVVPLSTGNVVVTSPFDDAGAEDAGAVYLFNGATGELISTLTGSSEDDNVGLNGVVKVGDGNFVIPTDFWDNGDIANAGAATFGNGVTGVEGVVSAANSLVGSSENDIVSQEGVVVLSNGNYVVNSDAWDDGGVANVGAVTFGRGDIGVVGEISAVNSLIGSTSGDVVGRHGIVPLTNGNYLVISEDWDNDLATNAGAVTFGNGVTGVVGEVSGSNSLIGSANGDIDAQGVVPLPSGSYAVISETWDNGLATNAGAVAFGNSISGVVGEISAANSLIGSTTDDNIGSGGVIPLADGNYVVVSEGWNNRGTAAADAGAVTFGDGTSGVMGFVSAGNSLIGTTTDDRIGSNGIEVLSGGGYVVGSFGWDDPDTGVSNVGAATFGIPGIGVKGNVSPENSLVGTSESDVIGINITPLANGNYVVHASNWDDSSRGIMDAGAATFGSGVTGVVGPVSASNSLIGGSNGDRVAGGGVTPLANGNYVVESPSWANGSATAAGAVTFGNGASGISGFVSAANSLVGSTINDSVGLADVVPLTNGNYVVPSTNWDNGSNINVGAVTFGNGLTGVVGPVSASNSLVGSTLADSVGNDVVALTNGNYVVISDLFDHQGIANVGAATFGNGTIGIVGEVSLSNSLIGATAGDRVGSNGVTPLDNGNYVVRSSSWNSGPLAEDVGAVTLGDGAHGTTGIVSIANSMVGSTSFDRVGNGEVVALPNGNFVFVSDRWINAGVTFAGAITHINGTRGTAGTVNPTNSLVGSSSQDFLSGLDITVFENGNYVVVARSWDNDLGGTAGAVTFGDRRYGVAGEIDSSNSLTGGGAGFAGLGTVIIDNINGNYYAPFLIENGGRVRVGSQVDGLSSASLTADLSAGTLTVADSFHGFQGQDNGWFVNGSNGGLFVSTSSLDDVFPEPPPGGELFADQTALRLPMEDVEELTLQSGGGDDSVSLPLDQFDIPITYQGGPGSDLLQIFGGPGSAGQLTLTGEALDKGTFSVETNTTTDWVGFKEVENLSLRNLASLEIDGQLNVNNGELTIDASAFTELGLLTSIDGGSLTVPGGLHLGTAELLTGHGTIEAAIVSDAGSTIQLNGDTSLGDSSAFDGINLAGRLILLGANTFDLLDGHKAVLGSQTTLDGGTLNSANGISLPDDHTFAGAGIVNTPDGEFENQGFVQCNGDGLTFNHLVTGAGDFGSDDGPGCEFLGGTDFGNSPAEISIDGNVTFGATNTHTVEIGGLQAGSEFDRVEVGQAIVLGGTLEVKLINLGNGYEPAAGDSFEILNFQSKSGDFDQVIFPDLPAGLRWKVETDADSLSLVIIENGIPTAGDDFVQTGEFTPIAIDILANDADPDSDTLTITNVGSPAFGDLTVNPDDSITYAPVEHFSGTDTFTYTIDDGFGGTDTAAVTITVLDDGQPSLLWQNPTDRFDVDDSGGVNLTDALAVVAFLRQEGVGPLTIPTTPTDRPPPFVDANGDDQATLIDALDVVARLRQLLSGGEGESASSVAQTAPAAAKPNAAVADAVATINDASESLDRFMASYAELDTGNPWLSAE